MIGSLTSLPVQKWVRVRLPFKSFYGIAQDTQPDQFDPQKLESINILQGLDDNKPHTLYIDEITVEDNPADAAAASTPPAPTSVQARGYDRHVDLTWSPVNDPQLQFYKIYRSMDGKPFVAIATQRNNRTRYEDFLGASGRSARYKVAAVNSSYAESPLSPEASASTREFSDDELLTMVQEACFRYYWEAGHPNAGMSCRSKFFLAMRI